MKPELVLMSLTKKEERLICALRKARALEAIHEQAHDAANVKGWLGTHGVVADAAKRRASKQWDRANNAWEKAAE